MSYYGFTVTDKGRALIAKLVAGKKLTLSRIMVGSGQCPDDIKPREMLDLSEPVAAATSTVPTYDGASVQMVVEYRSDLNGGLDHGFWLREFGIYAFDPDEGEVMIYYGCLGDYPQWVSAASETGVDVRRFPVCIIIGDDSGLQINYNCEAWMTAEDVEAYCTVTMLPMFLSHVKNFIDELDITSIVRRDIVIPASGWTKSNQQGYEGLSVDVPIDNVKEDMIPSVTIIPSSINIASSCGLSSCAMTGNGFVRFYSSSAPTEGISASLALLSASGAENGESYQLPTATKTRLGGVKIGDNVKVAEDGTISIDKQNLIDDISATDEEANGVINKYFENN